MIGNPIGYPIGGDLSRSDLAVVEGGGYSGTSDSDADRLRKLRRARDIAAMRAKKRQLDKIAAELAAQRQAEQDAIVEQANQIIDLVAAMRDLRAAEMAREDEEILMLLLAA
jgi:uncharacterized sporulation protein YeaH/YhbH (DUF444 family)